MADDGAEKKAVDGADSSDAELRKRLQGLEARLGAVKRTEEADRSAKNGSLSGSALGRAVRLSSELVAGVLVGGGLGYGLDAWAGTKPWGLIILLMIGFAAGVLNLVRTAGLAGSSKSGSGSPDR